MAKSLYDNLILVHREMSGMRATFASLKNNVGKAIPPKQQVSNYLHMVVKCPFLLLAVLMLCQKQGIMRSKLRCVCNTRVVDVPIL